MVWNPDPFVRPPRQDIAAPPLPPRLEWVGGEAPRLERLVATGPLLVHFFDLAQLNSVRAMPYIAAWAERYREPGLSVIGVHTARFPFTAPAGAVAASLSRLGVEWPVAVDAERTLWRDYGCQGWPSVFVWSRGGALRWYHLGEGEYSATEAAITGALEEAGREGPWPDPVAPLRPGDEPGAKVIAPTPEVFPGGAPGRPWSASGDEPALELRYEAGGAFAAAGGRGEIAVSVDGGPPRAVEVSGPGLYELAAHEGHGSHRLELRPAGEVEVGSIQFAPAPAG